MRKFEEVSKELFKFAVAHKSVIEIKDVYILHSTKTKTEFTKADFDFSKNGLDFVSYNDLKKLVKTRYLLTKKHNKMIDLQINFNFNKKNALKAFGSLTDRTFESYEELGQMCLDSRYSEAQIGLLYDNLKETVCNRVCAFNEGKVYCAHFNHLCSTYEGSTDENGETPQCCICMEELEIGTEFCQLPCGHSNCKTCIEGWFLFRAENLEDHIYLISMQQRRNQCPVCRHICS